MVVVYYREKCTSKLTGEEHIRQGQEWGHGNGRGEVDPQSTSLSLAIIAIYVIKVWYSYTNEAIVKIMG